MKMLTINVEQLATYRLGMEKGMEKGIGQGARRQALEIAKNMLSSGFPADQVASLTGLSLADIALLAGQLGRDARQ
jgi:predicted transposase/invertase (TIGR01784 family)